VENNTYFEEEEELIESGNFDKLNKVVNLGGLKLNLTGNRR